MMVQRRLFESALDRRYVEQWAVVLGVEDPWRRIAAPG